MKRTATILLLLASMFATAACESQTASLSGFQTASINWDEVTAAENMAHAPKNANLIFMR